MYIKEVIMSQDDVNEKFNEFAKGVSEKNKKTE